MNAALDYLRNGPSEKAQQEADVLANDQTDVATAGAAGVLFGIQRALEGDFFGAGLEITSGLLGATGVGGGLGLAIDGFLLGRDLGAIPMADGGIVKGMRGRGLPMLLGAGLPAVVGEGGSDEAVLPLNKKTFLKNCPWCYNPQNLSCHWTFVFFDIIF